MSCLKITRLALVLLCVAHVCGEQVLFQHIDSEITAIPSDIPLNVTTLDLKNNVITNVQSFAFSNYTLLINLDLSANKISWISREAFHGCRIERVHLQSNNITASELLCLEALSQTLIFLDISNNPIDLTDDVVTSLASFTVLAELKLIGLSRITFPNFPSNLRAILKSLSLAYSEITTIHKERLAGFPNLSVLALNYNKLESFPDFSLLAETNSLATVNLRYNRISSIGRSDLVHTPNLENLKLEGNELTSFPDVRGSNITELDLRGNPLICDSKLAWMKHLQESSLEIELDRAPCTAPSSLVGVPWGKMTYTDLKFGNGDPLLDGSNVTCMSTLTNLGIFHRKLVMDTLLTCVVNVFVVGNNLECWANEGNNGLQFFVNDVTDPVTDICRQGHDLIRCRFNHSEPALCQFECDCPANNGGCQEGHLFWKRPQLLPETPLICEVLIA